MPKSFVFAEHLLAWYDQHGRKNLPWQKKINAYRVWASEIMLQQTQVDTVIPYFERFMQRFPTVKALAQADIDEVLHMWTGLGYYARARNMHKCAQHVSGQLNGRFPKSVEGLVELPGIGPSTAAAISSIAFEQADAILDGNVKRVLARFHAVAGWPGKREVEQQLWQAARQHMPQQRCRDYTQAIMDLGATLCKRSKPGCITCPMATHCGAKKEGDVSLYPGKKPKKQQPIKSCQMLIIRNSHDEIALYQRPSTGIWGGLWSLPEISLEESVEDYTEEHYGEVSKTNNLPTVKHIFSHYTLMIHPVEVWVSRPVSKIMENQQQLWYNPHFPQELGLAAPVKKLLHA